MSTNVPLRHNPTERASFIGVSWLECGSDIGKISPRKARAPHLGRMLMRISTAALLGSAVIALSACSNKTQDHAAAAADQAGAASASAANDAAVNASNAAANAGAAANRAAANTDAAVDNAAANTAAAAGTAERKADAAADAAAKTH
jgi:hypothetical protein